MKKCYLLNFNEIAERYFSLYGNFSQKVLAESIGVSQPAINNWRKGRKKVPWDKLIRAVRDHNVTWDWLLEGRGPKYREKE
jgi:transcriptional regulator with XRE-family HTH domain